MASKRFNVKAIETTLPFLIPDPAFPVFMRIDREPPNGQLVPIYWGVHTPEKRFSVPGRRQLYLATSLATITEAAPWRELPRPSDPSIFIPMNEDDLAGYFISFIMPNAPIKLANLTKNQETYGIRVGEMLNPDDKSLTQTLAKEVLDEYPDIGGIMYPSQFNTAGVNIVIYDHEADKFPDSARISSLPLVDVVHSMKEALGKQVKVDFLFS